MTQRLSTQYLSTWRIAKRKKQIVTFCAAVLMALGLPSLGYAAPEEGIITSGNGDIQQTANLTTINQQTQRLDINWKSFSIGQHETVQFNQKTSDVAINRVIGNDHSFIAGALNAAGRIFILNNAGITFTGTSRVNVGALIASTAKDVLVDGDKYQFINATNGAVINQGDITTSKGGFAILAAPYVKNEGKIQANLGQIELASAPAFTVDLRGDNLITYAVSPQSAATLGVDNTGTLEAKSGTVNITAAKASEVVANTVNLGGIVDVDSFAADYNAGKVNVKAAGNINNTAKITANGGQNGNGGKVITLADNTNNFTNDATITAQGGNEGGDGGFVEVSGKHFTFGGAVNTLAPNGKIGTLLIDPTNINIKSGSGPTSLSGDTIYEFTLQNATTAITLQADETIRLENLNTEDDYLVIKNGVDITLIANRIVFDKKDDSIIARGGNITLNAGSGGVDIGYLETGGGASFPFYTNGLLDSGTQRFLNGNITITSSGDILASGLNATGYGSNTATAPQINLNATGNIHITDNIVTHVVSKLNDGVENLANAKVTLNALGNITLDKDVIVYADVSQGFAPSSVHNATSSAVFEAHAGRDLTINGLTDLRSTAYNFHQTSGTASSTATANLTAVGNLTVNRAGQQAFHITTDAINLNHSTSAGPATSSNASVNLESTGGNVGVNGNFTITADTDNLMGVAQSTGATTSAVLSVDADNAVTITGDMTILSRSISSTDANSVADAVINAGGNATLTGNATVKGESKTVVPTTVNIALLNTTTVGTSTNCYPIGACQGVPGSTAYLHDNKDSFGYYLTDSSGNLKAGSIIWTDVTEASQSADKSFSLTVTDLRRLGFFLIPDGAGVNNERPGFNAVTKGDPLRFGFGGIGQFNSPGWQAQNIHKSYGSDIYGNTGTLIATPFIFRSSYADLTTFSNAPYTQNPDLIDHVYDNPNAPGNVNWENWNKTTDTTSTQTVSKFSDAGVNDYNDANFNVLPVSSPTNNSASTASANFVMNAGNSGAGTLNTQGNINVTADSEAEVVRQAASATATISLDAPTAIITNGNVTSQADARYTQDTGSNLLPLTALAVTDIGGGLRETPNSDPVNITLGGAVSATATTDCGNPECTGQAEAKTGVVSQNPIAFFAGSDPFSNANNTFFQAQETGEDINEPNIASLLIRPVASDNGGGDDNGGDNNGGGGNTGGGNTGPNFRDPNDRGRINNPDEIAGSLGDAEPAAGDEGFCIDANAHDPNDPLLFKYLCQDDDQEDVDG